MDYMTFSSGAEACTVAWKPLGWRPVLFSEIAPFPCRLLQHHYPHVPNLGDMTQVFTNPIFQNATARLICAGTPCQDYSIAGLRAGLDGANGSLSLAFTRILAAKQPEWFVWENVPGVFSSFSDAEEGKEEVWQTADFATLLTTFSECGYSCAYRVLDAQYFGVPQRRRRVFVVGHLGDDWRPSAAVLFEPESLRGDTAPSRGSRKKAARPAKGRIDRPGRGELGNDRVTSTIDRSYGRLQGASNQDLNHGLSTLVYDMYMAGSPESRSNPMPGDPAPTVLKQSATSMCIVPGLRRLTPLEIERLQGFPDNYTAIPGAKDGPRYEIMGNSMAVPVMRWIGERIDMVDKILHNEK